MDNITVVVEFYESKMKLEVRENGYRSRYPVIELEKTETWVDTPINIYKKFEAGQRKRRYRNGCYLKYKNPQVHENHQEWYKSLSEAQKHKLYYGKGIVD